MELEYPSPRPVMPFEDWLDRRYSPNSPKLDFDPDLNEDHFETRATYAEYVVITWENPEKWLVDRLPLSSVCRKMECEWHVYMDSRLPRALRNRAWMALISLFDGLFIPQTSGSLGHLSETGKETKELDTACYMWWDVSPYYPQSAGAEQIDHERFLDVCEHCLNSSNPSVIESAIHGLGHAHRLRIGNRSAVQLLDDFLLRNPTDRRELAKYAQRATKGRVL